MLLITNFQILYVYRLINIFCAMNNYFAADKYTQIKTRYIWFFGKKPGPRF